MLEYDVKFMLKKEKFKTTSKENLFLEVVKLSYLLFFSNK